MSSLRAWSVGLLIPLLLMVLGACANTENDQAILSSLDQLKSNVGIVKAEVAAMKADQGHAAPAPAGPTAAEIEAIVAEAIAGIPASTTVEQIGTMPSRLLGGPINFTFSMLQSDDTWTSDYGDGPDFALNDIIGKGKPVVVNFLAAGCPPCWKELPAFQKVYNEHKDDIIMLGVDVGDSVGMQKHKEKGDRADLLAAAGVTFPVGVVSNAKLVVMYGLYKIPATITITGDGKLLRRDVKALSEGELKLRVEELLNL